MRTVLFVNLTFTKFVYYNIGQILKLVHKKNSKNISLQQWPLTDIRGYIYNSIAGGIIVHIIILDLLSQINTFSMTSLWQKQFLYWYRLFSSERVLHAIPYKCLEWGQEEILDCVLSLKNNQQQGRPYYYHRLIIENFLIYSS